MKRINYYLSAGLFSCASLAFAADSTPPAQITDLLKSRVGGTEVGEAVKTPAEGLYQTRFGSKVAYLTGNGRYILIGDMIDLQTMDNLTEISRRSVNREALEGFPKSDMVIFPSRKETSAVLNVFTDTSCGYCRKLHTEVPELQKAGIEVRYFPYPRGGSRGPGYQTMKQVWCAEDRAEALNIAKETSSGELTSANCKSAQIVDQGYALGNELGVTGTPALFTADGQKIDGYVPYQKLIPMLVN